MLIIMHEWVLYVSSKQLFNLFKCPMNFSLYGIQNSIKSYSCDKKSMKSMAHRHAFALSLIASSRPWRVFVAFNFALFSRMLDLDRCPRMTLRFSFGDDSRDFGAFSKNEIKWIIKKESCKLISHFTVISAETKKNAISQFILLLVKHFQLWIANSLGTS